MANKRDLKKQIRYACGDAAAEILTAYEIDNLDSTVVGNIVGKIANLQVKLLENATFSFDKTPRDFENKKAYHEAKRSYLKEAYGKLRSELNAGLTEIVKDMNATLTPEMKEANKRLVSK